MTIIDARNPNVSLYGTNPNASLSGNNLGSAGSIASPQASPAIAGFASAGTQRTISAAATYTVGRLLVGGGISTTRFSGLDSSATLNPLHYSGATVMSTATANMRYQATAFLRFGASIDYTIGGGLNSTPGAKYTQINLGTAYSLSKRTDLYLTSAWQHAVGSDSLDQPAVADIGYLTPSTTSHQVAVSAGIRHLF
jgi:predicted porin